MYEWKANPIWIPMWGSAMCFGYVFGDIKGAVLGLGIAMVLSFIATIISNWDDL